MRIAVISDIHGNCFALDAALTDLRQSPVDKIVCLGDTVQGGAQPAETTKRLRELLCPIVMGNSDAWLLNEEKDTTEPISQVQRDVRAWTIAKLSADDLDFMSSLPSAVEIKLDAEQILLCFHGSPHSFADILLPDTPKEDWQRLLGAYSPAIMTGGHTHTQQVRRIGEGSFFNPGSIGVAFNYYTPKEQLRMDPWAEYAVLSYDRGYTSLEFRRVPYNVEKLIEIIETSGRPHAELMAAEYRHFPR
jgi:putative phosphoesterase